MKCPNCKREVGNVNFCPNCGTKLDTRTEMEKDIDDFLDAFAALTPNEKDQFFELLNEETDKVE